MKNTVRVLLTVLAALCILAGCKASPALTEIRYDQRAEDIEENPPIDAVENSEENEDEDEQLSPNTLNEETENPRNWEHDAPSAEESEPNTAPEERDPSTEAALRIEDSPSPGKAIRQVVDDRGRAVDIPKDADTVAAVGELARMVQLLGGEGRLTATSETMREAPFSVDASAVLWQGSGKSPLSEEAFERLLEQGPEVCLIRSGEASFTEEQLNRLNEEEIPWVVLPGIATGEEICETAVLLGDILGKKEGADAPAKAQAIVDAYGRVKKLALSKTDPVDLDHVDPGTARYTLNLAAWDDEVYYSLHDDAYISIEGRGLPLAWTGRTKSPLAGLLALAGVAESGALKENCYSLAEDRLRYVCPIDSSNKTLTTESRRGAEYDRRYILTTAGGVSLGNPQFDGVIVPDRDTASKLRACPLWKNFGPVRSSTGLTEGNGFLDQNGDIVRTSISGAYEIYILPQGLSSWGEGGAESLLLPLWAMWRICETAALEEIAPIITDFYTELYGFTPTEDELLCILAPEGDSAA